VSTFHALSPESDSPTVRQSDSPTGVETPASKRKSSKRGLKISIWVGFNRLQLWDRDFSPWRWKKALLSTFHAFSPESDSPTVRQSDSPTGVETPASKRKSSQRGLKNSLVPCKRTINHSFSRLQTTFAISQGFQPLAGFGRMKQPCPPGKERWERKKEEGKKFSFSPWQITFYSFYFYFFEIANPPRREILSPRWYFFT